MKRDKVHGMANTKSALGALMAGLSVGASSAQAQLGQPVDWQKNLQEPASQIATNIAAFHDGVTIVIFLIAIFVLGLMIYVIMRFNETRNPTPSNVTHNTMLEVAWTVIPILILVGIAIPSFRLLFQQYTFPPPDVTIKATGNAWFWEHEYVDFDGFRVTSNMVRDEDVLRQALGDEKFDKTYQGLEGLARLERLYLDAKPLWAKQGRVRQLSVDNRIAVPENKVIHVLVTASDVIHNWTIPSFGSKVDAVPGRITATWFTPNKRGIFYGQCSELCGKDHSSMPIEVQVVSQQAFDRWSTAMKAAAGERDAGQRRELRKQARDILQQAALEDRKTVKVAAKSKAN